MKEEYIIKNILLIVENSGISGIYVEDIKKQMKIKKNSTKQFNRIILKLIKNNYIYEVNKQIYSFRNSNLLKLQVTKLSNAFAFCEKDDVKYYIQGKFLNGAMLGDLCLVMPLKNKKGETPEGKVIKILEYSNNSYSGTVVNCVKGIAVVPDNMPNFMFKVKVGLEKGAKCGDKISFTIYKYAKSHFDHIAKINKIFGDSQKAFVCCSAIINSNDIEKKFSKMVLTEAKSIYKKGISSKDFENRIDLRKNNIFTIDAEESKDLDDALDIEKTNEFYELSVHIADVSHYITSGSELDKEAFQRASSVYYANYVIPMLPKEISNGICSLSQGDDRLTFSCFMKIDFSGNLMSFSFKKSVINSKVKGIYSEINSILNKTASDDILHKYQVVIDKICLLKELTDILIKKKKLKHGLEIKSDESKIIIDENNDPIDIKKKVRGFSERIVEECMILANESCATFAQNFKIPFVYRVHEKPKSNKIETLITLLKMLNLEHRELLNDNVSQKVFSDILYNSVDTNFEKIVHTNVLRSMAKAKYDTDPIGHYGLVLQNYSHFTSPIRRYPDLAVHRIMTDVLNGISTDKIIKKYKKFALKVSKQSSLKELEVTSCERQCNDAFKAQYIKQFIGKTFKATISGIVSIGVYVQLENTVEGLVKIENFKNGNYILQNNVKYVNTLNGEELFIGKEIDVVLTRVSVPLGQVDFNMV